MAVDLTKFKKNVEKRLPILFMIDESGEGVTLDERRLTSKKLVVSYYSWFSFSDSFSFSEKTKTITNMDYAAAIMENVVLDCRNNNIRAEIAVVSYGEDWCFRYPILDDEEPPYFEPIEYLDIDEVSDIIRIIPKSDQAVLGSALEVCKALLDDTDTVKPDRYKPVVIVLSAKTPSVGWESYLDDLLDNGRSSNCQMFWVNIGSSVSINRENLSCKNCNLDGGLYHIYELNRSIAKKSQEYKFWEQSGYFTAIREWELEEFVSENDCEQNYDQAIKNFRLGKEYTITEALGSQFRSIKLQDGNNDNKTFLDTVYIDKRTSKFNGAEIAAEIVKEIKFEPIDEEQPEAEPIYLDITPIEGEYGDGSNAKGGGTV